MREFVYFSRTAWTTGNFKDLMKAGRLDIACHTVIMAFFISRARRQDVKLHLFFYGPPDPPKHIIIGPRAPISKKDIGSLFKIILYKYKPGKLTEALEDCFIEKRSLIDFIESLAQEGRHIYILDERGQDIRQVEIAESPVFIFGDHRGLPLKEKKRLSKKAKKVSLGKVTYMASQALAILQNELDRRGL
ncbi:MAG: hypothetical protein QXS07_01160 [Candidatus Pacearchaeota archaeon]